MLNVASQLVDVSVQTLYQRSLKLRHTWLAFHLHILKASSCMCVQTVCVCNLYVQSACWPTTEHFSLLKCSIAVQTLFELHCASNFYHLDLSPDNIMLRSDKSKPWDTLRLIDFGFASKFNPGRHHTSLMRLTASRALIACCHLLCRAMLAYTEFVQTLLRFVWSERRACDCRGCESRDRYQHQGCEASGYHCPLCISRSAALPEAAIRGGER